MSRARTPLLARLRVGTKLMLLALLPVCVLLGFTTITASAEWHAASELRDYQAATRLSFATAGIADQIAAERTAAVLLRLRPTGQARAALAAAQRDVNQALHQAEASAAGRTGTIDVAGRLDAARMQLGALRLETASGSLSAQQISQDYGTIADDLITTVSALVLGPPTRDLGPASGAYAAILQAIEAAQRDRLAVATVIGTPGHPQLPTASGWVNLENAELDTFREEATGQLAADLEGVLFTPVGITVQQIRGEFLANPQNAVAHTSLGAWLNASGARLDGLRSLQSGAASDLAASASQDLHAAQLGGIRDLAVSLAVLAVVVAFALALRRSITRPLSEVSEGARKLSSGDLASDVRYAGRDEIGDVAAAFRNLHVTAERLADEIRATNAAISASRLDHRADVSVFEGTWAELLREMNATTAAFAALHELRRRAERELEGIFTLSLDLLCIAGEDGYFKRVNPAFERTLGYTSDELLSRPLVRFIHPDDQDSTAAVNDRVLRVGDELSQFENRYIRRDGAVRWLQWSARPVPEEGLIYAAARDVTDGRRARQEQAALRRVATLVAKAAAPAEVFDAVVAETHLLLSADNTRLLRYEPDNTATVVACRSDPGLEIPVGTRDSLDGRSPAAAVWHSRRPVRLDGFEGPPGSIAGTLRRLGISSAVGAPILVEDRLWGVMVAAWRQHQPAAGLEDRIAQFTELVATAISNAQARVDLAASRARVVAASDDTRRRIERDLHDGAQQQLVSLALQLRTAQAAMPPADGELTAQLDQIVDGLTGVLNDLRELARGIHPAMLAHGGLGPALKALARRCPIPLDLDVRTQGRLPEPVEVCAYYVTSEALTNAAKHSHASAVTVRVLAADGVLCVRIRDDGAGGAHFGAGSGLVGLRDRVEALGGHLAVHSKRGDGTSVTAEIPLGAGSP